MATTYDTCYVGCASQGYLSKYSHVQLIETLLDHDHAN